MADLSPTSGGRDRYTLTAAAAVPVGECRQLANGLAGGYVSNRAASSGQSVQFVTAGPFVATKLAGQVWIDGCPLWWDHSANNATCVPPLVGGDRDFFIGSAVGDAASADTTGTVMLNQEPRYEIDFHRDGGDTAVVLTSGTPTILQRGGTLDAAFSTTAEAQKLDWLSKRSFALGSNWILEAVAEVVADADADVADCVVGVANGTHASDADAITESAFFKFNLTGADLNIYAESDDGTTEVAATDTTLDWAVGTPVYLVLDGRDPTNVKYYVNGVEVLSGTANLGNINAAAGPLKALFHFEKSSDDSPGRVQLDMLRVRTAEQ